MDIKTGEVKPLGTGPALGAGVAPHVDGPPKEGHPVPVLETDGPVVAPVVE